MKYKMQILGIRSHSATRLRWSCILISENLSESEQPSLHDKNSEVRV